jgi:hypothetical protein
MNFETTRVCRLTGLRQNQLSVWAQAGHLTPVYVGRRGANNSSLWSERQALALAHIGAWWDAGLKATGEFLSRFVAAHEEMPAAALEALLRMADGSHTEADTEEYYAWRARYGGPIMCVPVGRMETEQAEDDEGSIKDAVREGIRRAVRVLHAILAHRRRERGEQVGTRAAAPRRRGVL